MAKIILWTACAALALPLLLKVLGWAKPDRRQAANIARADEYRRAVDAAGRVG